MIKSISLATVLLLSLPFVSESQQINDWLTIGHISHQQGDITNALKNYTNYIEQNPNDPIGYVYRARLYGATQRKTERDFDLKIAERLNPLSLMYVDPSLRSQYAAKKSFEFDFDNIENAFVKSPSRYHEYRRVFNTLELQHSQDSLIEEIIFLLNSLEVDEAELLIEEIDVNDNNKAIVFDLKGKVALKRGEYIRAKELFSNALEHDPSFSIAFHNRSICHKLLGDYELARKDLESAIELNNDISLFYFTFAKLNEYNGDQSEALANYSNALSIDSEYEEALINYGQLLKGLGQYEEGINYLSQGISQDQGSIENTFLEANLHFVYGSYEEAIREYDRFLVEYPDDSEALFNRGLSLILMRRATEGCRDIYRSLIIEDNEERERLQFLFCTQPDF